MNLSEKAKENSKKYVANYYRLLINWFLIIALWATIAMTHKRPENERGNNIMRHGQSHSRTEAVINEIHFSLCFFSFQCRYMGKFWDEWNEKNINLKFRQRKCRTITDAKRGETGGGESWLLPFNIDSFSSSPSISICLSSMRRSYDNNDGSGGSEEVKLQVWPN